MFIEYNPNPYGRRVGDCTVRAICKLTDQPWEKVYMDLAVEGFSRGDMPSSNDVWGSYLKKLGYERTAEPNTCPDCYTVADFCAEHPDGAYLLALASHVVATENGDYFDIWDSGDETVNYSWRIKKGESNGKL